jgi:hypothetical protein
MVAGTEVLGSGFVLIAGWRPVATTLWALGIALWVILFHTVVASLTLREPKPDLASSLNGGWLVLLDRDSRPVPAAPTHDRHGLSGPAGNPAAGRASRSPAPGRSR